MKFSTLFRKTSKACMRISPQTCSRTWTPTKEDWIDSKRTHKRASKKWASKPFMLWMYLVSSRWGEWYTQDCAESLPSLCNLLAFHLFFSFLLGCSSETESKNRHKIQKKRARTEEEALEIKQGECSRGKAEQKIRRDGRGVFYWRRVHYRVILYKAPINNTYIH